MREACLIRVGQGVQVEWCQRGEVTWRKIVMEVLFPELASVWCEHG